MQSANTFKKLIINFTLPFVTQAYRLCFTPALSIAALSSCHTLLYVVDIHFDCLNGHNYFLLKNLTLPSLVSSSSFFFLLSSSFSFFFFFFFLQLSLSQFFFFFFFFSVCIFDSFPRRHCTSPHAPTHHLIAISLSAYRSFSTGFVSLECRSAACSQLSTAAICASFFCLAVSTNSV